MVNSIDLSGPAPDTWQKYLTEADGNGDGKVTRSEVAALEAKKGRPTNNVDAFFSTMDPGGKGYIDASSYKQFQFNQAFSLESAQLQAEAYLTGDQDAAASNGLTDLYSGNDGTGGTADLTYSIGELLANSSGEDSKTLENKIMSAISGNMYQAQVAAYTQSMSAQEDNIFSAIM